MIQAVRKTDRIVQIGMQRRSAPAVIEAKRVFDSGILGKVTMAKPMWNWNVSKPLDNSPLPGKLDWKRFLGKAKDRDLEPMRFRSWRYFWDYSGGNMTGPGHASDGRGAVVQRRGLRQIGSVFRTGIQEYGQRSTGCFHSRLRILRT